MHRTIVLIDILCGYGNEVAIIWEGNDPKQSRKFTYSD
ncbi:MAG: hypothetical protein CM15mP106_3770 [Candidatus Neomarinimicrobiota bacterium]|nr:MAG: hypothetical protein CM15mP106_3770 [Candidatus Neomarinimicrobiota bacterium]